MTGRDETPDEALREQIAVIIASDSIPWYLYAGSAKSAKAAIRSVADAVLAVVLSPERDEALRQEGRTEVWRHIADAPQQKSGSW